MIATNQQTNAGNAEAGLEAVIAAFKTLDTNNKESQVRNVDRFCL
jgi:hypothetical protein